MGNHLLYTVAADGHLHLDHTEGEHKSVWHATPLEEPNRLGARNQCGFTVRMLRVKTLRARITTFVCLLAICCTLCGS